MKNAPTQKDIGRSVIYRARHPGAAPEVGIITSIGLDHVFVCYNGERLSKATRPMDLTWMHPSPDEMEHAG